MEPTYLLRALDDKTYGPYTLESIKTWIREGRIGPETPMSRCDVGVWQRAGNFTELAFEDFREAAGPTEPQATPGPGPELSEGARDFSVLRSGASWYYWIAGLTAVNAGAWLAGSDIRFVVGTALVDVINAFADGAGLKPFAIIPDTLLVGFFVVCGIFAHKGHIWAFLTGMAVYALDTILCLLAGEWIGVLFHCWALFSLGSAFRLAWQMRNR